MWSLPYLIGRPVSVKFYNTFFIVSIFMPKCFAEHQMTIRYDFQPSLVSINLIKKRTVNPYVTGSSPVARAKDFPQDFHSLWDFLLSVARPALVQKWVKVALNYHDDKTKSEQIVPVFISKYKNLCGHCRI